MNFRVQEGAVGELGSPPPGLPALVARRREHRVTGVQARTESRSLETRGPNATGSRQTDRGYVMQRPTRRKKKPCSIRVAPRGLDRHCSMGEEGPQG